jgi:hypothetical protein
MKQMNVKTGMTALIMIWALILTACKKDAASDDPVTPPVADKYTIEQTLSDEAQKNTIAFDGLAFLTGNVGSQSFLPPGKVSDYSGFQYLRDNDPTDLGHNTDFVTIIAFNVLHILTEDQIRLFVDRAQTQVSLINDYAYMRYPLIKAFRRLYEGDLPAGCTGLNKEAVKAFSSDLYVIDGQISYNRAQVFGTVLNSLTTEQRGALDALKSLNGVGHWNRTLQDPLNGMNLRQDVKVAVMTYASEIYSWYAGSVDADVYFCPERQGTYFGSFYLKDWPAMGNPNYSINEQLTASAGQNFLNALTPDQAGWVTSLVNTQRAALLEIVDRRRDVSVELRKFMAGGSADSSSVIGFSKRYGELDGEIVFNYATQFSKVRASLSAGQVTSLEALANELGYMDPSGGFLYSQPIPMPEIINTDFLFK